MLIRYLMNIALLFGLSFASWQVMEGQAPSYGWQCYLYMAAPWCLLFGSSRAWHRCFTWRRMMAGKNIAPTLSRGKRSAADPSPRISILEVACLSLLALSIAAILTQMGIDHAALYIGVTICAYIALGVALRMVR